MKRFPYPRILQCSAALLMAASLLGVGACSDKKGPAGDPNAANIGGQAAGLQCAEGEFADAAKQAKLGLKLQTSLYHSLQDQVSSATLLSAQDLMSKDGQIYYARSIPGAIGVIIGSGAPILHPTLQPTLSLKFLEKDGQVILAAGNYTGIDYYTVSGSSLTPLSSNRHLGAVTDMSARDGKLCVIADGGKAVVQTGPQANGGGECSSILYQAGDHKAANGMDMEASHVAAVPEGCLVVTRNIPKLQIKLMEMVDFLKSFINETPQRVDLRGIEEKVILLGADGSRKDVAPTVGSYDKLVVSDLDPTADGAVATYTAFKKANWDAFSAHDAVADPARKLVLLLKLILEVRGGGLFISQGQIQKNAELQGAPINFTILGINIDEIPHFSLPWFPDGAVDGTRYALKAALAFSIFDIGGLNDPNLVSLPVEQYTWIPNPNPLSQPKNPKGLFTDFGLAEKKLFTNGLVTGGLQANYDYDAGAKKMMNNPPYPAGYKKLPAEINRAIPLGSLRDGYFGLIAGSPKLYHKKASLGSTPQAFLPGAHFGGFPNFPSTYKLLGMPTVYESPAGGDKDKFVLGYFDSTNHKILIEALKSDGGKSAVSDAEVDAGGTPILGAVMAPVAIFEDVVVAAVNMHTIEWRLYAWKIDEPGQKLVALPDGANPNFSTSAPSSIAWSIHPAGKTAGGLYSVLVLQKIGGVDKVVRVNFKHDGSNASEVSVHEVSVPDVTNVVSGGGKAFAINKAGDVIPLDLSGETLVAGAPLGKILDDPAHKIFLAFCGLNGNDIYCSGLFEKSLFALYKFATESRTQTTYKHNRPFLLSFTGSKLLVTYSLDGGGIEAFDVTKPAPEPAAGGGAITTGDGSGSQGAGAPTGGLPAGGSMGGGGCGLTASGHEAAAWGALLVMACVVGGSLAARRRRHPVRR